MSKTDSFPAPLTRSNPQYILTKELQRLRRFGVSDLAFRPRQYPRLSALRAAAGQQPTQTMEVLAECQALFRAAFDMFPTVNLRQAAAILFHLDSDATPPPLADRRRLADKTYAGCNTARHDETIRRTLERDIDRLMLEFLPLVSLHCRTAIQASPEDCVDDARGCVDYAIKDEQGTGAKPTTRESATNRRDALKALGAIAATATAPRAWQQPLLGAWDATGDALEDLLRAVREPTISCLADGADQLFAQAVVDAGGDLIVIVPAAEYRQDLPAECHPSYDRLLAKASKVVRLNHTHSDTQAHMDAGAAMLDLSEHLLAVWDGKPARGYGGTADVVKLAQTRGIPVTVIWPNGATRD